MGPACLRRVALLMLFWRRWCIFRLGVIGRPTVRDIAGTAKGVLRCRLLLALSIARLQSVCCSVCRSVALCDVSVVVECVFCLTDSMVLGHVCF